MKFNIFKKAFSLTELLIVLVVVAVLFAAMIPMATKRNRGQTSANEPVWMFVKDDPEKSAFYDPGSSAITSAAYVGFKPETSNLSSLKPFSKVVLRAKEGYQNHIQFRTGNDGNGTLAGVFIATPQNMVLGSRMRGDKNNNYNELVSHGTYNTVLGSNAAANIYSAGVGTVVGASAGMGKAEGTSSTLGSGVSVGSQSNLYGYAQNSTLIGANTGKTESISRQIQETVAIGAGNLGLPTSSGRRNVLMGYNVGSVGFDSTNAMDNVVLNSSYYGTTPSMNTIIGYKTYEGGFLDAKRITAIGYNACASVHNGMNSTGSNGNTTCIGYNSASKYGKHDETKYLGWDTDSYDHLFIGGKPQQGFPGRSVLEVHNVPYKSPSSGALTSVLPVSVGPTVVMNSNLVVRGNLYIPDSNDGQVAAFANYSFIYDREFDSVKGKDRCGRKCLFGRRGWRDGPKCKWLKIIAGALLGAGLLVGIILSGAAVILAPEIIAMVTIGSGWGAVGGLAADALFNGEEYDRPLDPATFSAMSFVYNSANTKNEYSCSSNYAPYFTASYCPNVLRTSDERLKENISENNNAISKLLLLEPYNYNYKADGDKTPQVGVMAQDLENIFPNAVAEDSNGYKNIRLDEIFYVVINSIKSLDSSVSTLDKDVTTLESNVVDVDKDHKAIRKRINDINKRITKLEKE